MTALIPIDDPDGRQTWGGDISVPGSPASLINAVILKAVTDLFSANILENDRADAFAFLTAKNGSWAESRDRLCWLVNIDPDLMRVRIFDILEGKRDLANLQRQGVGNLEAEHGRKYLAEVRQREEASRAAAKVQAERVRARRDDGAAMQAELDRQEKADLDQERRIFEQRLKAAEREAGLHPQHRRRIAKTEYLENDGLPLGQVLRIDDPWEPGTYCTFLQTLLPSKSNSMGRAVAAACSAHGFVLELNRPGFTGGYFVQSLGYFIKGVQVCIEGLLCFLWRDISDGAVEALGVVPIDPFQSFPFDLAHRFPRT